MKCVLLTGGTSQLGVFLLPRLLRAGCRILAPSRRIRPGQSREPARAGGRLSWIHPSDLGSESGSAAADTRPDALVSAGPVGLAPEWVPFCREGARVVCFSSSSVLVKADSPDQQERSMMASMRAAEDRLRQACAERAGMLCLLRPTLIYGCGLDANLSRIARWVRRFRFLPVAGPASGLRQPVHADDLAALAMRALEALPDFPAEAVVPGGETISFRVMTERVFEAFDLPPRVMGLPPAALAAAVSLAGVFQRDSAASTQMVWRQNRDLVFDDGGIWSRSGHAPREFHPSPADFVVPASTAELLPG
ncbi:NAD-dependent epimerase/dehydratase family protein [Elongatibacter sediminis]|uniref:NAD(P)-dependent oxidoreductase n=1 Tax=Elongatibacter sediminis TaxID=3119006 RepID=A0AAW9RNA2_9GAMM